MAYKKTGDAGNGGGAAASDMDAFMFNKWLPFAEDQGFVANQAPVVGTAPDREIWTHNGNVYCFFKTSSSQLWMFTGTGLNTGQELFDQPGNPCNSPDQSGGSPDWTVDPESGNIVDQVDAPVVSRAPGPYTGHHLFSNASGDYIHCALQVSARRWRHFFAGQMIKFGNYTGGQYMMGHTWSGLDPTDVYQALDIHYPPFSGRPVAFGTADQRAGFVRCQGLQTGVEWFVQNSNPANLKEAFTKSVGDVNNSAYDMGYFSSNAFGNGFGSTLWACGESLIANATPLIPILIFAAYDYNGNDCFVPIGQIPDVYRVNMKDYQAGDVINYGGEDYVLFPLVNNNIVDTVSGDDYSGWEGLAYRIIP